MEYPDDSLLTLCETCHNDWHKHNENIFKDNPTEKKKLKKRRKPRRHPNKKHKFRVHRNPRLCLAIIQANKDQYEKLKDGTW